MKEYDTLKFYNEKAYSYFNQTKNSDMSKAYQRFTLFLPKKAYILDFGCGSGRDSKFFIKKGYTVTAVDGSQKMCDISSEYINQEVKCMKFDELTDVSKYDGIWACSSLLHVERFFLKDILNKMIIALKSDGVIYASFKIGNKEVVIDGKYYNYITKEILEDIIKQINPDYKIVDYFENETVLNVNRPTASWGNYLIKRIK